jgi:hypothetical protein
MRSPAMPVVGIARRQHVPDGRGGAVLKIRGRPPELDERWSVKLVAGLAGDYLQRRAPGPSPG